MEFKDPINYLEFWEYGFEGIDDHVEPSPDVFVSSELTQMNSAETKAECSEIREPSPDILNEYSQEEILISSTCLNSKRAAILNQINVIIKTEKDEVKLFILNYIRKLLITTSSCTSRELFYICPRNISVNAFYRKVRINFYVLSIYILFLIICMCPFYF